MERRDAHPAVGRVVHEAVQFDTLSRFVVARDVAESLDGDLETTGYEITRGSRVSGGWCRVLRAVAG